MSLTSEGLAGPPVTVEHPALLIRINKLYRPGMSDQALYDATRGVWRLTDRRHGARYALAVYKGIVREVYRIESWHPIGTTEYRARDTSDFDEPHNQGRWEFIGSVAEDAVRHTYLNRSVAQYFPRGAANPVTYCNC